jgi:hypothetical protein
MSPENAYIPPKKDSAWFIQPPMENILNLDGDVGEWMQKEDEIRAHLKSRHNFRRWA